MRGGVRPLCTCMALVWAACGGSLWAPPEFQSGTRLRAMLLDAGGGVTMFMGWFDSQLGVSCDFFTASDGKLRCLPSEGWTEDFADQACTDPVWMTSCSTLPDYLEVSMPTSGCEPAEASVFRRGAPRAPPASLRSGSLGACLGDAGPIGTELYGAGAEVDPSAFVAATTEVVTLDDGSLAARVLVAEDGASQILALVNARTGEDCWAFDAMGNPSFLDRCLPAQSSFEIAYSDPACTSPANAVVVDAPPCGAPTNVAELYTPSTSGACTSASFVVEKLGAAMSSGNLYVGSPETCTSVAPTQQVRAMGPLAAADEFPLVATRDVGTGRLHLRSIVDRAGHPVEPLDELFDTQLRESCTVAQLADGMRCVPSSVMWLGPAGPYEDPQCTVPLIEESTPTPNPCEPAFTPPTAFIFQPDTCSSPQVAYVRGNLVTPSYVFYSDVKSGCTGLPAHASAVYHELVAADDSVWAPVKSVTE